MAPAETPRDPAEHPPIDPVLDRFVLETEPMGDGRLIHYYRWPEPDADPAGGREFTAPAPGGPDV